VTTFGSELKLAQLSLKAERLETRETPQSLFVKVHEEFENAYLLESAIGAKRLAEYSFIGFEPQSIVRVKDGNLDIASLDGAKDHLRTKDPLQDLRRLVAAPASSELSARSPFRFIGGAVGYISYDSVRYWERLPAKARDDLSLPDMEFGIYTDGIVFDHIKKGIHYYTLGESRLKQVESLLRGAPRDRGELTAPTSAKPTIEKERFKAMIETAKKHITVGDIFQVVLAKRYDFELDGDLSIFYEALSEINPSPYMYFLKFGERRIVGSSPEMLVRVENRQVETFPIAGTRPHLEDKKENAKLTRHACRPREERRRPSGQVWERQGPRAPHGPAVQPRPAHRLPRRGDPPPRVRLLRRHASDVPSRHRLGRAQAPGHGDNRRPRASEARPLRGRARLLLLQRQR
jgi:anthranilate synthase component 1